MLGGGGTCATCLVFLAFQPTLDSFVGKSRLGFNSMMQGGG